MIDIETMVAGLLIGCAIFLFLFACVAVSVILEEKRDKEDA